MDALRDYKNADFVYSDDRNSPPNKKYGKDMAQCGKKFLKTGIGSDVTIIVKDEAFKLHSIILGERSAVFKAMFAGDSIEARTRIATINHYERDVILDLFHYIYTCSSPNIEKTAAELLGAANEYGLDDLKAGCAKYVVSKLSLETACMVFCLGKKFNLEELVTKATNFIKENINEIPRDRIKEVSHDGLVELFVTMAKEASPKKRKHSSDQ